jgi:choline dehydrogenase-like flavoprotein
MFLDLRASTNGEKFEAPICIIGAGAAGITLALELAGRKIDVILLEAGGLDFEDDVQSVYDGTVVGHQNTHLSTTRLRQFGGTTGHWTGLSAPLDPIDFEKRDAIPHSGWPITRKILDPFYKRAHDYLELGAYSYRPEDWAGKLSGELFKLDPALVGHAVYQQSPPTRFGEKYRPVIEKSRHIKCLYHASVSDISLNDDGATVSHVEARTLTGKRYTIKAGRFVIACGGIENPRMLLNCNRQRAKGLGNEHGLVGRYFMDHLFIEASSIALADAGRSVSAYNGQHVENTKIIMGLTLPDAVLRREKLTNNVAFLTPVWESASHNDDYRGHGWVSFATMAKTFARGHVPDRFANHWCNIAEDLGGVTTGIARQISRRFLPAGKVRALTITQDAEQVPNPQSRVYLGEDKDPFGWQRAVLDWRILKSDMENLRRTHILLGRAIGQAGIGRLKLGIKDPSDFSDINTAYHHLGTTRMHADPRQGVVDADCRLHSINNLYVAGSSVFTTGGTANPTITIVALAIRLADRLAGLKAV